MNKERLFYLDFVRAFATVVIVLTHYNALYLFNVYPSAPQKAVFSTRFANIYIGGWGVSLFLIISGASLMYVYGDKFKAGTFYKKRIIGIFPMFWLAYGIVFLYNFYNNGSIPAGIPKRNIIFSILGMDQYLSNFSVRTFACVGEWFLGFIILIYIVFPLLRTMVNKYPIWGIVFAFVMYSLSFVFKDYMNVSGNLNFFVRLPEFLFGMYFVKYIRKVKFSYVIVAVLLLLYNICLMPPFDENIQTTYIGIASFIVLVYIANFVKCESVRNICSVICKYSYACFLIHHFVIYKVAFGFDINNISVGNSYLLFLWCVINICIFSFLLYQVHSKIMLVFKKDNYDQNG